MIMVQFLELDRKNRTERGNLRGAFVVMNTRRVYLSAPYRAVVLINSCLNFVLHGADRES